MEHEDKGGKEGRQKQNNKNERRWFSPNTHNQKKNSELNKFSFEGVEYLNKNFKHLSKQRIHTVVSGIIHWSE